MLLIEISNQYVFSLLPWPSFHFVLCLQDNILITGKGRACLADFGLSSAFDTDDHFRTAPSQVVMGGTYNYMAPEIFNAGDKKAKSKVNRRACDMYALGCTIYAVRRRLSSFKQCLIGYS
jgi:serine/threonine protein kinase